MRHKSFVADGKSGGTTYTDASYVCSIAESCKGRKENGDLIARYKTTRLGTAQSLQKVKPHADKGVLKGEIDPEFYLEP